MNHHQSNIFLPWILFSLLNALCLIVGMVLFLEEPPDSQGYQHPDKSTLQQNGNMLLDDSGNKYYKKNGIYYLLPIKPKENLITVITRQVIIDKGINKSEKYSLFESD